MIFLLMPSVNSSYWILMALASILYMMMYMLLFLSAIVLRYKHPNVKRVYQVPGGKIGMWIIAGLGFIGSSFGCFIGFLPPSQLQTGSPWTFTAILLTGSAIFCILPLFIYGARKPPEA
jgi:hypothetical protein